MGRRGVSETELHGDSNRRVGRKARSGPATGDRGPWTVDRPFRRVLVATKAGAGSLVGEPDPRSFSLENAG